MEYIHSTWEVSVRLKTLLMFCAMVAMLAISCATAPPVVVDTAPKPETEMARATDMGEFYRVPADSRGLNYNLYFTNGSMKASLADDYNSHNAKRLSLDEMVEILLSLPLVQKALAGEPQVDDFEFV